MDYGIALADGWVTASRRVNSVTLALCGLPAVVFAVSTSLSPPSNDDWGLVGAFLILDVLTRVGVCLLPAVACELIADKRPDLAAASAGLAALALAVLFSGVVPWWSYSYDSPSLLILVPAIAALSVHATAAWRARPTATVGVAVVQATAWILGLAVVPALGQLLVAGYQQRQNSPDNWTGVFATYLHGWAAVALWVLPEMALLVASAVFVSRRPSVGVVMFGLGAAGLLGLTLTEGLSWPWLVFGDG